MFSPICFRVNRMENCKMKGSTEARFRTRRNQKNPRKIIFENFVIYLVWERDGRERDGGGAEEHHPCGVHLHDIAHLLTSRIPDTPEQVTPTQDRQFWTGFRILTLQNCFYKDSELFSTADNAALLLKRISCNVFMIKISLNCYFWPFVKVRSNMDPAT